jgi:hypothetical protein
MVEWWRTRGVSELQRLQSVLLFLPLCLSVILFALLVNYSRKVKFNWFSVHRLRNSAMVTDQTSKRKHRLGHVTVSMRARL